MHSIVEAAKLTQDELRMLGTNVVHAVEHDGEDVELDAVNRSLDIHGEGVDELACLAGVDTLADADLDRRTIPIGALPNVVDSPSRPAA